MVFLNQCFSDLCGILLNSLNLFNFKHRISNMNSLGIYWLWRNWEINSKLTLPKTRGTQLTSRSGELQISFLQVKKQHLLTGNRRRTQCDCLNYSALRWRQSTATMSMIVLHIYMAEVSYILPVRSFTVQCLLQVQIHCTTGFDIILQVQTLQGNTLIY